MKTRKVIFPQPVGIVALGILAVFFVVMITRQTSVRQNRLNVLLILADTLRADHLGSYGYQKNTSPHIDRFAEKSIVFENAISQGAWTKPSVASLFTSLYPHNHGALSGLWQTLTQEAVTLPEALRKNGYNTVGFQTNLCLTRKYHFDQGFDEYNELIAYDQKKYAIVSRADEVVDEFLKWTDRNQNQSEPFFAYVHFMDCHLPYRPPAENRLLFEESYQGNFLPDQILAEEEEKIRKSVSSLQDADRQHIIALYDASIHYLDSQIGRLLDSLSAKGLLDSTIVIILSDHGEEFFEHGGFGHGYSLYNEVLRTPFILWHPTMDRRDIRIRQTVRHIDIYPTLLSLLHLKPEQGLFGTDLSPLLLHPETDLKLPAFSEKDHGYVSIQKTGRKLIHKVVSENKTLEFYDLVGDPNEINPLKIDNPLIQDYEKELASYENTGVRLRNPDVGRPDEEEIRNLKSLGYLH